MLNWEVEAAYHNSEPKSDYALTFNMDHSMGAVQNSDIITYSIAHFITIRRIMVRNLVSNGWGASAAGGIGVIVYDPDPRLGLQVRQLCVSAFMSQC